jgi:uncharacterized membrane-anchored protein
MNNYLKAVIAIVPFTILYFGLVFYFEAEKNNGKEFVLQVVSRDPNDLLRGEYVNLQYDINRVESMGLPENYSNYEYCVVLSETVPAKALSVFEKGQKSLDNMICGTGFYRKNYTWSEDGVRKEEGTGEVSLTYNNIQKYFLPRGTGGYIDKMARENKLQAVISLAPSGRAYIKYLQVDGKKVDYNNLPQ